MIDLSWLPARPVAVLGLGRSGLAAAQALRASGRDVWAWDDGDAARAGAAARGVAITDLRQRDLRQAGMLLLSPGIPHTWPAPHPVVDRAREAGCEIIGDVELLLRAQKEATCIGVTGTNGKSTTTALIGHILKTVGLTAETGANIGFPALALPPLGQDGIYVLELSSYQLEITPSLACKVAVLLNISPDHLARHGGLDGYMAAKRLIFRGQRADATAVVGVDDDFCRRLADEMAKAGGPRVVPISGRTPTGGVYAEGGRLYDASGGAPTAVLDLADAPALPGEHNAQNAAAAFAAVRALGVDTATAAQAIETFPGLPHRQQLVRRIGRIAYVNDSKATNGEAAARALACYQSVYWIVGGLPKEGGLAAAYPYLDRVRHAYLIGEAADAFAAELRDRVPATVVETLDRAVDAASRQAERNGTVDPVVLLSPACASFDQFENFERRGDAFRMLVEELGR